MEIGTNINVRVPLRKERYSITFLCTLVHDDTFLKIERNQRNSLPLNALFPSTAI